MMKRTQICRRVRSEVTTVEASLEATLAGSMQLVESLRAARKELGLNGTVGDAAIARLEASVAAMEEAKAAMYEGHAELYQILQSFRLPAFAGDQMTEPPPPPAIDLRRIA